MNTQTLLFASALAAGALFGEPADTFRFMTFNIYGSGYGGFEAVEREDRAVAVVRKYHPDLISWQEVNSGWWKSKLFTTMDEYAIVRGDEDEALVRAGADLSKRKGNWLNHEPLMYRKDRFELLDHGLDFYHIMLQFEKSLTWAVLKDRTSGRRIIAMATHFWWKSGLESDAIRELNARHILWRLDTIRQKWGDLPVVFGGDLNCTMTAAACRTLVQFGFDDAGETAPIRSSIPSEHGAIKRDENGNCYGTVGVVGAKGNAMIDHVFFSREHIKALRHDVVTDRDAINISDHSPVIADLQLLPEKQQ